ncbi:MAG: hypothetical protein R3F61_29655 [Myxococcota bacterium]
MTLDLQRAVAGLGALTCVGIAAELALASHWHAPVQVVPFVLAGLGVVGAGLGLAGRRGTAVVAGALALGGGFGIWEHLEHNYGFAAEIAPTASASELVGPALVGANPLLAPGAFLLAAALVYLGGRPRFDAPGGGPPA